MKSRRRWIVSGSAAVIGIAVATAMLWSSGDQTQTPIPIRIARQRISNTGNEIAVSATNNLVRDFYSLKYSSARRAKFHVTASEPVAISVLATGVEILTDSGWEPFSEEPRIEIWRLKPGIVQELFVERPEKEKEQIWRAYIRYGTEMKGPRLLKWQLKEAWQIRSFTNWTGKAWGGGRFGGANVFFSNAFSD